MHTNIYSWTNARLCVSCSSKELNVSLTLPILERVFDNIEYSRVILKYIRFDLILTCEVLCLYLLLAYLRQYRGCYPICFISACKVACW